MNGLARAEAAAFDDVDGEVNDLFNQEDIELAAARLQSNSSAALLVYEQVWATKLRDAIVKANGRLVENDRIPADIVEAAMAAGQ